MCSPFTPIWMCRPTSWSASANASRDGLLVLGVDPGLADTGYGAVRRLNGRLAMITCGTLKTPANLSEPQRLRILAEQMRALMAERSEEHTSELQSLTNLVCRLLLEKKKQ